jgi:hypothetical protein
MSKNFTEMEEMSICNDYRNDITLRNIQAKYKIDQSVIYRVLRDNNIPNKNDNKINNIFPQIQNLYIEKNLSCSAIAKIFKISRDTVSDYLKANGITVTSKKFKYKINEKFFENIDTPEKAQILGLIYADGCILDGHNITMINLKEDDVEYLKIINNCMEHTKPVHLCKKETVRFFAKDNKFYKCKNAYSIRINNIKIKTDLMKLGVEHRKTYTNFKFPDIDRKYYNSFILGYFEGDGCITTSSIKNRKTKHRSFSILAQPKFAEDLQKIFKEELMIDSKIYIKKSQPLLRTVSITKIKDLIKLYHWLYRDTSFCMIRKHTTFTEILNFIQSYGYDTGVLYKFD